MRVACFTETGAGEDESKTHESHAGLQGHYFIGYYLYHATDCSVILQGYGHEHDLEGVNVTVRKDLMRIEAAFTNVHGHKVAYVPVYGTTDIADTSPDYGSQQTRHLTFVPKHTPSRHSRLAVGVEARTHAVWGRWDDRCVIGRHGAPSGCSGAEGGDGLILSYDRNAPTPQDASLLPRPQYPAWQKATYKLLPMQGLLGMATNPAYSGDACETGTELYAVSHSAWNEYQYFGVTFNGCSGDNGQLPWVWGRDVRNALGHPCQPAPDDGGQGARTS